MARKQKTVYLLQASKITKHHHNNAMTKGLY